MRLLFVCALLLGSGVVAASGTCPADFPVALGNLCVYKHTTNTVRWCDAQADCKSRGGELIRGEENLQSLIQHARTVIGTSGSLWVGLTDSAEESVGEPELEKRRKKWRWTDNTRRKSAANWNTGEPNAAISDVGHLYLDINPSALDDVPFDAKYYYVCQPKGPIGSDRAHESIPTSGDTSTPNSDMAGACDDPERDPNQPFSVGSLRECAHRCSITPREFVQDGCQTFYYNKVENKCLLVKGRNAKLENDDYDDQPNWMRYG